MALEPMENGRGKTWYYDLIFMLFLKKTTNGLISNGEEETREFCNRKTS
jgi:hypothetical protein